MEVDDERVIERLLDAGNVRIVDDDFVELINPFYEPLASSEATVLEVGAWSISRLAMTVFSARRRFMVQARPVVSRRWVHEKHSAFPPGCI